VYDNALTILSTVISRPVPTRAVVDAGLKSLSTDSGMPEPKTCLGSPTGQEEMNMAF
jgi:D-serine deaminase-like pyridoxal phosphate-dependent protein